MEPAARSLLPLVKESVMQGPAYTPREAVEILRRVVQRLEITGLGRPEAIAAAAARYGLVPERVNAVLDDSATRLVRT